MTYFKQEEVLEAICNVLNEGNIILVETKTSQEIINKVNKFFDRKEWVN